MNAADAGDMQVILHVPLLLTVEIGRTAMSLRDVLAIADHVVIALDRLAGEPLDILINGRLIAKGEVVVVNERLGMRLIEMVDASHITNTVFK